MGGTKLLKAVFSAVPSQLDGPLALVVVTNCWAEPRLEKVRTTTVIISEYRCFIGVKFCLKLIHFGKNGNSFLFLTSRDF